MIIKFVGKTKEKGENKILYFLEGKKGERDKEKIEILEGDLEEYKELEKRFCPYDVKGYHYVISFKENLDEFLKKIKKEGKNIKDFYEEVKKMLFYPYKPEDLETYAVAHADTNHFHIHIYVLNSLLPINRALRIPKTKSEVKLYEKISEYFNKKYGFEFERRGVSCENFLLLKKLHKLSPERIFSFSSRQEKEKIKEEITSYLKGLIQVGVIETREDIKKYLENSGIEVVRYGKRYMTIKYKDKRIRLKGGIYDAGAFEEIKRELRANFERDRGNKTEELRRIQEELRELFERRKQCIEKKYRRYLERDELELRSEAELFENFNCDYFNDINNSSANKYDYVIQAEDIDEQNECNFELSTGLEQKGNVKSEFEEVFNMNLEYREVLEEIREKELEEIKNAEPERILDFYGINYKKSPAGIYYMLSPLRHENNPSFVVFYGSQVGRWVFMDLGSGWSGSIIDFVMEMDNCDYQSAVSFLRELYDINYFDEIKQRVPKDKFYIQKVKKFKEKLEKRIARKKEELKEKYSKVNEEIESLKRFELKRVGEVKDKRLLSYLKERKIKYIPAWLKEVEYEDRKNKASYVALGVESVSGAYHLRNPKIKMVLKTNLEQENTYSLIRKGGKGLIVVEGLFDGLSVEQFKKLRNFDILILNSVNNLKKAIKDNVFIQYKKIILCLDKDKAGEKAKEELLKYLKKGKNEVYEINFDAKDINEAICSNAKITARKIKEHFAKENLPEL